MSARDAMLGGRTRTHARASLTRGARRGVARAAGPACDGQIHLWWADLQRDAGALAALRRTLAPEELEQAGRYRRTDDRVRFEYARGVLRAVLARHLGATPHELAFRRGPNGKPELACGGARFNLSHSHDVVLCAVAHAHDVGVDVELVRPGIADVVGEWLLSPTVRRTLAQRRRGARQRTFFRAWTRMEACVKASGVGLPPDLAMFERLLGPHATGIVSLGELGGSRCWWVQDLSWGRGYMGAVAAPAGSYRVRQREWHPDDRTPLARTDPVSSQPTQRIEMHGGGW